MNVSRKITMAVLLAATSTVSLAWDPLLTKPEVLKGGQVLPGDNSVVNCLTITPQETLELSQAVDMALCHNSQIRSSWIDIKTQADNLGVARSAYLPTVSVTVNRLHSHTTYPDLSYQPPVRVWGTTAYANLTWHLLDGGGRSSKQKSATQLLNAAIFNNQAAIQKALSSVTQAYFDAITANAEYQSQQKIVALAQQTMASNIKREALGVSKVGDTLQAGIALSKANLELQRGHAKYKSSLMSLAYQVGLPTDSSIELPELVSTTTDSNSLKELNSWLTQAKQHPAMDAAEAKLASSKEDVRMARSGLLPSLDFSANYYQNGYPGQGLTSTRSNVSTYGLTLNIPLFNGFSEYYKVRAAEDQVEKNSVALQDTQAQITAQVRIDYADADSALHNLQASATMLVSVSELLKSMERRYAHGDADVLDMLGVQNTYAQVLQERVRCLADWQSSKWKLIASVGGLGREMIRNGSIK